MEKQFNNFFLIVFFATNCSFAMQDKLQKIDLEELKIGELLVFKKVEYANGKGYYRYISQDTFLEKFGKPDDIIARMDELMETEIIRMMYGKSYIEFFDHSFNSGLDRKEYSLYSINFEDDNLWVSYQDDFFKVGAEQKSVNGTVDNQGQLIFLLNRGKLNELSD
jgi:hypothetical protein